MIMDCGITSNVKRYFIFLNTRNLTSFFYKKLIPITQMKSCGNVNGGGDIFHSHGTNHSNGVAILVKKSLKYEKTATYIDQAGRILLIEIKFNDKVFVIGNVYAPTKDNPIFFNPIFSTVVNFSKHDSVLGGDWNLVLDNKLDKDGGPAHSNQLSKKKNHISTFLIYVTFSKSLTLLRKALRDISHNHTLPQGWIFFLLQMSSASSYNQLTSVKALSQITKLPY